MNTIKIKPLSVNQAWCGKRFKTPAYKAYETELLWLLPKLTVPKGQLFFYIEVGFSNKASDIDNILKPFQDVLQKRYGFDDKDIYELQVVKDIVPRGKEYIKFDIGRII